MEDCAGGALINPYVMQLVQFDPFPRTYVCGLRIHHGLLGCILAVIGAALAAHDRCDFPWPVIDPSTS